MADNESLQNQGLLSPQDLQVWLAQEVRDSAKAHELRTKEATDFVTRYASGKLSAEGAAEALYRHDQRWGEALFGATATPGLSDDEIVQSIDRARKKMLDARAGSLSGLRQSERRTR